MSSVQTFTISRTYYQVFKIDQRSGAVIQVGSVSREEATTFELTLNVRKNKRFLALKQKLNL